MKKLKCINNGILNRRIPIEDDVPDGWVLGARPMTEEEKRARAEKTRKTNLKKYGVENPFQSEDIKNKIKETNLKKYGVENPAQSESVQSKMKATTLKRYGVEHALQSKEIKDKQVESCISRYGVENAFQSEEVKEKSRQTMLERYGVENPSQSKEIQDKKRETSRNNYGTGHPMQSQEIKDKSVKTNLVKYGTEYPIQNENIKRKQVVTNLERYGVEHPLQLDCIKEKSIKSSMEHWGVENPSQSKEVQETRRQTFLERYGVENPAQSESVQSKIRETNIKKYGYGNPFQSEDIKKKIRETNLQKYGYLYACMRPEAKSYSNDSSENREFAALLESYGVKYEREFPISRYSYDFKVGNRLIEIDPFPFHNTIWSPIVGHGPAVDRDYHQRKSHTAEAQGYQVIHIFDWDDKNKIVQSLLPRETVYARKCSMREVSYEDCTQFLIVNHLQGSCRGQDIRLGLYINDELISIMTFGYPRYNKNYQYELLRYCSSKNVIGGAGKLLANFLRTYDPESVISYCDRSKFRGDVYSKLGFILKSEGKPSCHWYSPKEDRHITDNLLRARGYDQIFNESYGKGTSNEELIINRGYYPVYDCGQDTYLWIKDKCR